MAKRQTSAPAATEGEPTFEHGLAELESIVDQLEDGAQGLEDSLKLFERGVGLLRSCYAQLDSVEQRIEALVGLDAEGRPQLAPFEHTATTATWGKEKPLSTEP